MRKPLHRKNKSTYFLDECITIHWPGRIRVLANDYELSVSKLGPGATDEKVLNYAIKHNRVLVTADIRLTLWSVLKNHPVVFLNEKGNRFLIKANSKKLRKIALVDQVTKYLIESNTIVIP